MVNLHQLVLEITQNLFKNTQDITKIQDVKQLFLFFILCLSSFTLINAQEIDESTDLKFQNLFFDALTQKAIKNYGTAIDKLDECNQLTPNKKAVLFELSKNYLFLNKIGEATELAEQALQKDPENTWILEHLVKIYKKSSNYTDAIKTQQKIIAENPKKKGKLVFLHLQNKDRKSALVVLKELENSKMLTYRLRSIQNSLLGKNKSSIKKEVTINKPTDLKSIFNSTKSFKSLKKLLTDLDTKNDADFLQYSEKGLHLFPAQPFVYLMNAKALNKKQQFKKAISSLENGVDFIIDNNNLEQQFYKEFVKSYNGLGDKQNANKFSKKISN